MYFQLQFAWCYEDSQITSREVANASNSFMHSAWQDLIKVAISVVLLSRMGERGCLGLSFPSNWRMLNALKGKDISELLLDLHQGTTQLFNVSARVALGV